MIQSINQSYFAFHDTLFWSVAKKEERIEKQSIMKWENSHVFLLEKVGGAVFRGGCAF